MILLLSSLLKITVAVETRKIEIKRIK